MTHPAEPSSKATRHRGGKIQWDIGQYGFLVWFHVLPARLFLVLLCLMVSFPSTWVAATMAMVVLLLVVDTILVTVRERERGPSSARVEVHYLVPLPARRVLGYLDIARVLSLFVGMARALWANTWWPARGPLSAALVAVAGVGLVASLLRQARRVRLAGA